MKSIARIALTVSVLTLASAPVLAQASSQTVSGTNPRPQPQTVSGTNPRPQPQTVSGTNPRPQPQTVSGTNPRPQPQGVMGTILTLLGY